MSSSGRSTIVQKFHKRASVKAQDVKFKAMVEDIRKTHPDKKGRTHLSWQNVADWVMEHSDIAGGYDFNQKACQKWYTGKDHVTQPMLRVMTSYCIAHTEHTSRGTRATVRAAQTEEMMEDAVDGDASAAPAPKRQRGAVWFEDRKGGGAIFHVLLPAHTPSSTSDRQEA